MKRLQASNNRSRLTGLARLIPGLCLLSLLLLLPAAARAAGSDANPSPSPTAAAGSGSTGGGAAAGDPLTALEKIVDTAATHVPVITRRLEKGEDGAGGLLEVMEDLAWWVALAVIIFSFIRLIISDDGASKNLMMWLVRLGVLMAIFGLGPKILTSLHRLGLSVVRQEAIASPLEQQKDAFDESYMTFCQTIFQKKLQDIKEGAEGQRPEGRVSDKDWVGSVTGMLDVGSWNLTNVFFAVSIARCLLEFSNVFLLFLGEFVLLAFKLLSPLMIAVAVDRSLAQRMSYPFAWTVLIFSLITPLVSHVITYLVFASGNLVFATVDLSNLTYVNEINSGQVPQALSPEMMAPAIYTAITGVVVMIIGSLLMFTSPYISYKLCFGQLYEAVSSSVSNWMGALTSTGVEYAGLKIGTSLSRAATQTQIEGGYQSRQVELETQRQTGQMSVQSAAIMQRQSALAQKQTSAATMRAGLVQQTILANLNAEAQKRSNQNQLALATRNEETSAGYGKLGNWNQETKEKQTIENNAHRETQGAVISGIQSVGGAFGHVSGGAAGAIATPFQASAINEAKTGNQDTAHGFAERGNRYLEWQKQQRVEALQKSTEESNKIADFTAGGTKQAAGAAYNIGLGGVEQGYRTQLGGIKQAEDIGLQATEVSYQGGMKSALIQKTSAETAANLNQMSAIVQGMTHSISRRVAEAMQLRF